MKNGLQSMFSGNFFFQIICIEKLDWGEGNAIPTIIKSFIKKNMQTKF